MSEFHVRVVRLGKIGKHPNADSLSITQVHGKYPVVFKTGEFNTGDLAIHIPPDALVPVSRPEFEWLADKATGGLYRVRFAKLRGVPSFGFLIPVPKTANSDEAYAEGQDVRHLLGVEKYDPGQCYQLSGEIAGDHITAPQLSMVPLYDIEGLRKYESLFTPGEPVVITEKIHGSNARWIHLGGELFCGSRTRFRKNSVWNKMAEKYELDKVLSSHPGLVLFGEVYGHGIQDLNYGREDQCVAFFDLYDTRNGLWRDYESFSEFCCYFGLPVAPVLYRGPFDLDLAYRLAEGQTTLDGASHIREGIVVRPERERWDQKVGRVQLKLPGEGYLLR